LSSFLLLQIYLTESLSIRAKNRFCVS